LAWQESAGLVLYRIETDRFGRTIMSPPPAFGHARYAGKIIRWLNELLPSGQAMPETPVLTADGIKVIAGPKTLRMACRRGVRRISLGVAG
jgi:hypothetical protein